MSTEVAESAPAPAPAPAEDKTLGMRKNGMSMPIACDSSCPNANPDSSGKQWHAPKKAFRPGSGLTSYEQRAKARAAQAATKAKEKEMKEEKEAERQVRGSLKIQQTTEHATNFGLYRGKSKPSKTNEKRRLRKNDTSS